MVLGQYWAALVGTGCSLVALTLVLLKIRRDRKMRIT